MQQAVRDRLRFQVEEARAGLVGQVPAARRAQVKQKDRAGVDGARAARRGPLHEAAGRGLAARSLRGRRRAPRDAAGGMRRDGVTFADAAAEYLRFSEEDRGCKPSTIRNYRNAINVHLLPVFGEMALEDITVRRSSAGAPACRAPASSASCRTRPRTTCWC